MRKHTMILSVIYFITLSFAQGPDTMWTRTYGRASDDEGRSVQQTSDGGYVIVGWTRQSSPEPSRDVYLIKTDSLGDTLWTKSYGGTGTDEGNSIQQISGGGYIVVGLTDSYGAGGSDIYFIKTDSLGDSLWARTYGGTDNDYGKSVQQTTDGGYIIAGYTSSFGSGNWDFYLIKTDTVGDTLWTRTYGGGNDDRGLSVDQTTDGGYIMAGLTESYGAGNRDVYLIKTDSSGDSLWARTYGGPYDDVGYSVKQTVDVGYIIAGYSMRIDSFENVYLVKTNEHGDTLWTKTYGGPSHDVGYSVQQTSDDGYIIAGAKWVYSNRGWFDVYLIRTNVKGDTAWTATYGYWFPDDDIGFSVQQTTDGGYIVAGVAYVPGLGDNNRFNPDVYLIKTYPFFKLITPNGGEAWPGGTPINITWLCKNPMIGNSYLLLFSTDGGNSYPDTIASGISLDSLSWTWSLPHIINPTCRINIQLLDSLNNILLSDVSDSNFAILESTPPIPFNLISPPDSSILSNPRPTFVWESSFDSASGLQNYEVYIDDTLQHTGIDTTWLVDYDLQEDYNAWFVVAYDSVGNSRQSNETWTVLIDTTPPSAVDLIAPPNYSYLNDSTVNFIWHEAYDNFSGIDYYLLQFALDSAFSQSLVETTLVDTILTTTLSDTIYYWRVKAFDVATNEGEFSSIWRFGIGTDSTAPTAPTLLSPIDGIILNDTLVTFEWTVVTNLISISNHSKRKDIKSSTLLPEVLFAPIRYIIQIDTLLNFVAPMIIDTVDTSSTTAYLHENFPFYWRVKAYDWAGNQGSYASPDSFGIDVGPVIESTTVWIDTSYAGPFEIFTKVTDNLSGVDSVILYYQRDEDPDWISSLMPLTGTPNWYLDSIPAVDTLTDTVRYYIEAVDNDGNTATDPAGAPANCYTFIANYYPGILDIQTIPNFFSFGLKTNPARNKAFFRVSIPGEAIITLRIYDVCGRLIAEPISGRKSAGIHEIQWTTNTNAAGIYFYALESPWQKQVGKLVIVK